MKAKLIIRHILWAFLIMYFATTIQQTIIEKAWHYWAILFFGTAMLAVLSYSKRDKSNEQ